MVGPRPLRITHIVRQFAPGIGGLEDFVNNLTQQQVNAGHAVKVVTLRVVFDDPTNEPLPARDELNGVIIERLSHFGSKRYPIAPGVIKHIHDADIVHVHAIDFFCDFLNLTRLIHRKTMVLTTHGGYFHTSFLKRLKQVYFRLITRISLTGFSAVIACGQEDEKTFSRIRRHGLETIDNAVNIEKFSGLAARDAETMIYFGRLSPNKNITALLKWFKLWLTAEPGWRLIIAGKPMGVNANDLIIETERLGLAAHVEFHFTPDDSELAALIGRSSVYVCASDYEGFGLAPIEAAAAGLYPVLSAISPFKTTLRKLGFGTTVDFNDPASCDNALKQLPSAMSTFQENYSAAEIQNAVSVFNWQSTAIAYEDVYRRVLGEQSRKIYNIDVDVHTKHSALAVIMANIDRREAAFITFCNAHSVNMAAKSAEMREALVKAMILNDGVGVDIGSRLIFGKAFPANLNGTDFVPELLEMGGERIALFLLGSAPGVAARAANSLRRKFPELRIVGEHHGYFGLEDSQSINAKIRDSGANLILVAMGQPRQEIWAAQNFREFDAVTICVGALFDFISGDVARAPRLVRKLRLEWAFRLTKEPRRLAGRYLIGNLAFVIRILRQKISGWRI